jgi:heterodisulfide reductase subunit B
MGYSPWELGLQMHQVSVEPLLDKLGIEYNKEEKYLGVRGQNIGEPQKPQFLIV